jgi:hypothetical protein
MVMDQLILFHKLINKVSSEKMVNYPISQTKHPLSSGANYVALLVIAYVYSKKNDPRPRLKHHRIKGMFGYIKDNCYV